MPHPSAPSDRAILLYSHPEIFISAACLLEQLLPLIHACGGSRVRLSGRIPAALAYDLAAWGACLIDCEDGHDAEDEAVA